MNGMMYVLSTGCQWRAIQQQEMNRNNGPSTVPGGAPAGRTTGSAGTTDAGKTGRAGTSGASDSSIPGATNPNEPMKSKN
jgi:hypothetical protein